MKALQGKIKILKNSPLSGQNFRIILDGFRIANSCRPGQFAMLQVNDGSQVLLRRPFSIHNVQGLKIEFLYEVVGKGTEILSRKRAGEYLDVIAPLGNGFSVIGSRFSALRLRSVPMVSVAEPSVLVAGGMGVAPLLFLAKQISAHQIMSSSARNIIVLIGAKTKNQILCEKEFKKLGCDVRIATDDGSKGSKGYVSELLIKALSTIDHRPSTIYACGPKPMLEEVSKVSLSRGVPAQVSLEAHMACGIGACLGCVVNTRSGFKRVCKDGPVFDAQEIIW